MADETTRNHYVLAAESFLIFFMSCYMISIFIIKKKKINREVIVFTRYPIPGKAKTRLIPYLGETAAAKMQMLMTEHMINVLQQFHHTGLGIRVTVQYNGGSESQMKYWLERRLCGLPCSYHAQADGDLGAKLKSAVKASFDRGSQYVIVIGSDIPGIDTSILQTGFDMLAQAGVEMVLGPAQDGGYYLVGFNRRALKVIDHIFEGMDWGSEWVFQQQMARAQQLQIPVGVHPVTLHDVDTEEDIEVFEKEVKVSRDELTSPMWSIIIPTLNEAQNIKACLQNISESISMLSSVSEIVVSDGGSVDDTVHIVDEMTATYPLAVKLVHSKPGRGHQLIAGVKVARGHRYLVLHADSRLPKEFDTLASACLDQPGVVAGAFGFQLDVLSDNALTKTEPFWFVQQMRLLVWGTNKRATVYEKPYGDQALFMDRRTYRLVGGFPPYRLMEDYVMVEKLRTVGHVCVLHDDPVVTSYRRWQKYGYFKVTGLSQVIILAYHLGVHPDTLAGWYHDDKTSVVKHKAS
ncbi:uncharacterized protein LOC127858850 isoform X2 [Dreissena polymorpha]|uniref:uncharacterized protein LOC127858850 isoform X2 n=1 Tax=Dreissena polymorpha TaxID=45954 RepID=UPI002264FA40|nr:uncharacterized protein LOC127858850 isoform X2 [Dreissena polymorpha]